MSDLYKKAIHDENSYDILKQKVDLFEKRDKEWASLEYALSLASYYQAQRYPDKKDELYETGRRSLERLLTWSKTVEHPIHQKYMYNMQFYIQGLPIQNVRILETKSNGNDILWKGLNPFIITLEEGLLYGIRMTDFDKKDGNYFSAHGYKKIQNRYELIYPSGEQGVIEQKYNYTKYPSYYSDSVEGMEDFRGCWTPEGPILIGVSPDAHKEHGPKMSLVSLNLKGGPQGSSITDLKPLYGSLVNNSYAQKNWLPFWENGKLKVIYASDPLIILEVNRDGSCSLIEKGDQRIPSARGSSPPVPWRLYKDGLIEWIYSLHFVLHINRNRVYYHRFVTMCQHKITGISRLFYIENNNTIEYISGASWADGSWDNPPEDKDALFQIGYGKDDKKAAIATLKRGDIEDLFLNSDVLE